MNYHEHIDNSKSFRALTGISHEQFCAFFPYFEAAHEDYLYEYEMTGERRSGKRRSPSTYRTCHTGCCNSNKAAGTFGTYVGEWNLLFVLKS